MSIHDVPSSKRKRRGKLETEIDTFALFETISLLADAYPSARVVIEKVGGSPRQAGQFAFGRAYGLLEMACVAAGFSDRMCFAPPQSWKADARLIRKGATYRERKEASRALAGELFPSHAKLFARVCDDGRAEAALIARYGARNGL